jgi:hypothetical protein
MTREGNSPVIQPLPIPLQLAVAPKKITARIREIARFHVGDDAVARFVDIRPLDFCSAQNCHRNVRLSVQRFGGSQRGGWAVNHVPGEYYEFIAHSVWIRPADVWVDVTPEPGLNRRLFVPDNSVGCDGASPIATRFFADGTSQACIRNVERMNVLAGQALNSLAVADKPSANVAHAELSRLVIGCLQRSAQRGWVCS